MLLQEVLYGLGNSSKVLALDLTNHEVISSVVDLVNTDRAQIV